LKLKPLPAVGAIVNAAALGDVWHSALEKFARYWAYHHKLLPEQMEFGGVTAIVKEVTFYHGGDQLYVLENLPGIWNEPCLEPLRPETYHEHDLH